MSKILLAVVAGVGMYFILHNVPIPILNMMDLWIAILFAFALVPWLMSKS